MKKQRVVNKDGTHRAIGQLEGFLNRTPEENYELILPDGKAFEIQFKNKTVAKAFKGKGSLGKNIYICYPKMVKGKLFSLTLVAWGTKLLDTKVPEKWTFIGVVKAGKLTVHRDINLPPISSFYKETGKLIYNCYQFTNSKDYKFQNNKEYKIEAIRQGDKFRIKSVRNQENKVVLPTKKNASNI